MRLGGVRLGRPGSPLPWAHCCRPAVRGRPTSARTIDASVSGLSARWVHFRRPSRPLRRATADSSRGRLRQCVHVHREISPAVARHVRQDDEFAVRVRRARPDRPWRKAGVGVSGITRWNRLDWMPRRRARPDPRRRVDIRRLDFRSFAFFQAIIGIGRTARPGEAMTGAPEPPHGDRTVRRNKIARHLFLPS